MFIGHALFAFAVAALVAQWRGWRPRRALAVGVVAGAFAAIPDVDVAYAFVGFLQWQPGDGVFGATTAFWDASRGIHRSATHSLAVGALAATAFALRSVRGSSRRDRVARAAGAGSVLALIGGAFALDGPLTGFVLSLFAASGLAVATVTARRTSLSPATVGLAALWGLWSHPWGDLVTGSPPEWAYPFEQTALTSRVVLHADPTVHLLGAFALELAVVWVAALTWCRLTDRALLPAVDPRAAVGLTYGVAAVGLTPPTLEVSYHFVFSILGIGLLGGAIRTVPSPLAVGADRTGRSIGDAPFDALFEVCATALVATTVALVTYAGVYLLVVT